MANHKAIYAVCEGVLRLLKSNCETVDFNCAQMEYGVYLAKHFREPMKTGVSLFLYRVFPNSSHRTPGGRIAPDGRRYGTQLPLDLHFLLTAWGAEASLQHTITGWMMRVLEDEPILPPGLLNSLEPDIFHQDETVEVNLDDLKNEDLLSIWRDMVDCKYQLSIPYVARNIRIESTRLMDTGAPVIRRVFAGGKMQESD